MTKIRQNKIALVGMLFTLPAFLGFLIFMVYPLVYSFYLSFMDWDMFRTENSKFIGFENYLDLLDNYYFQAGITNNIKLAIIAVPVLIAIALVLASFLNMKIYGRAAIRAMYFMPYIVTVTAAAIVFSAMFHPVQGPVNAMLSALGVENLPGWATSSQWSLFTVGMFWVWKNVGYCVVIFLAALQGVSRSYYEAAEVDGATKLQQFFNITVPLVSPTTFFLSITCIINSFQIFAEVNILTQGGPGTSSTTIIMHIYDQAFVKFDLGYASAVAWAYFALILVVTAIQFWAQKKWVKYV